MPDTFPAHGVVTTIGVAPPLLTGVFVEGMKEAPAEQNNWKLESMWGSGPNKPLTQYPVFDSERVVEELVDRNAHR